NERAQQLIATITDVKDNEPEIKQVGNTTPNPNRENPQTGRTYNTDGLAPTLNTMQGGNRQPQIVEPNKHIKPINPLKGKTNNGWQFEQEVYDEKGMARALKAGGGSRNIPKTIEGIPIKNNTDQGYLIAKDGDGVDLAYPTSNTRRGRVQENISQTLTTDD